MGVCSKDDKTCKSESSKFVDWVVGCSETEQDVDLLFWWKLILLFTLQTLRASKLHPAAFVLYVGTLIIKEEFYIGS